MLLLSRSLSYLFIFISFWYYTAADQLIVQSERLRNFHGCSSEQQLQIRSAWWEAVNIAKTVRNRINFDHYAENDYFGRPSLNENFRDDIKALIFQAGTYGLAGPLNPYTWQINITCLDWHGRCKRNVMATATNPESRGGVKGIFMDTITFCPEGPFLDTSTRIKSCPVLLAQYEHAQVSVSEDMYNYQCWGWVVLHELFHLNSLSRVSSTGHVYDRTLEYYEAGDTSTVKMKVPAYGPSYTKILANYASVAVGGYVATNADNLAQYALAKWVQTKCVKGYYPKIPQQHNVPVSVGEMRGSSVAYHEDGTMILNTTAINIYMPYPPPSFLASDNICDVDEIGDTDGCIMVSEAVTVNGFTNSNDPISSVGTTGFADEPAYWQFLDVEPVLGDQGPTSIYDLPADPWLECQAGLEMDIAEQSFVSQSFVQDRIGVYCNAINGLNLDALTTTIIPEPYEPGTDEDTLLWLIASWQVGDPECPAQGRTLGMVECVEQLGLVLDSCDADSVTRKYGGSRLNDCVNWGIYVNGTVPLPAAYNCVLSVDQPGSCDCSQANIPVQVMPLDSTGSCDLYQNGGV